MGRGPALSPELSTPPLRASHLPGGWTLRPPQPGVSGGSTKRPTRPRAGGLRAACRASGGWSTLDPSLGSGGAAGEGTGAPAKAGSTELPQQLRPAPASASSSVNRDGGAGSPSPETLAWGRACPVSGYALPLLVTVGNAASEGAPVVVGWTFQGEMRRVGCEIRDPPGRTPPPQLRPLHLRFIGRLTCPIGCGGKSSQQESVLEGVVFEASCRKRGGLDGVGRKRVPGEQRPRINPLPQPAPPTRPDLCPVLSQQ